MKKKDAKPIGYYPTYRLTEAKIKARRENDRKSPRLSRPRLIVMLACAGVFLVCATLLVRYYGNIHRAKEATAELKQIYQQAALTPEPEPDPTVLAAQATAETAAPTETPAATVPADTPADAAPTGTPATFAAYWPARYEDNPELRIAESFQNLRRKNRDVVGWLTIDGVLDEPVLQRDNEYYLTHDSSGEKNVTGALFLDESCNLRTLSHNLIIHGHNMKEGAMFGSLKKYKVKDAEFYRSHPYITFNTLYEEARYVIFAVSEINVKYGQRHYLPFWEAVEFSSQSTFDAFMTPLREYSHFQTQVDVQPGDRLLTLATCSGEDENLRLLVAARKIRDNEDPIALQQGIMSTSTK